MTLLTLDRVRERLHDRPPARIADSSAGQAAVALIVTPESDDLRALFIRRAQKVGDPWSGQMGLPGGRRDPDDSDLYETAVRETLEETGIQLGRSDFLGQLDDFTPRTPVLPNIVISSYVFGLPSIPPIQPSSEVSYHIWATVKSLKAASTSAQVEIRGSSIVVPAYVLGNDVIWGLTERIIKPFIDLLA